MTIPRNNQLYTSTFHVHVICWVLSRLLLKNITKWNTVYNNRKTLICFLANFQASPISFFFLPSAVELRKTRTVLAGISAISSIRMCPENSLFVVSSIFIALKHLFYTTTEFHLHRSSIPVRYPPYCGPQCWHSHDYWRVLYMDQR